MIIIPWTGEVVDMLNAQQNDNTRHPYTCPGDYSVCENQRELIATCNGWVCRCGRYTQDWAYG